MKKLTTPKSPDEYFQKTEFAVKHAYDGIAACWAYFQKGCTFMEPPVREGEMLVYSPPTTPEGKAKLKHGIELQRKYFELKISEAIFAGSIFQAAYMAIWLYKPPASIPKSLAHLVKPSHLAARFCTGKECHGVQTGLIIYAARNQYNHWGEGEDLNALNKFIFDRLAQAFDDDIFADLAFELTNPTINIYANEILLTALRWHSYEIYLAEMKQLLNPAN